MNPRIRVLLIEDNPGDARLIQAMLDDPMGGTFAVEWVDNLGTGVERLAEGGVDVVLLDLGLPDSSGLEGLRTIRSASGGPTHAPVVVLSGQGIDAVAFQAVQEGAQDYLVKGEVDRRLLTRSIRYAIERNQADEQLRLAREELERRVDQRTADLHLAVDALRTEVAERKSSEEALRESEERFRVIFKEAGIGISLSDVATGKTQANRALLEMLGRTEDEVLDIATLEELTHPDDRVRDQMLYQELLDGTQDRLHQEKRFLLDDGRLVWADLVLTLVRDGSGAPRYMVGMLEDISQRKRAEAEQARLELELRQAQKMEAIGRLAGGVAHDFNNLLTAVTGYAEFLLTGLKADDPLRADAEEIRRASERATALTHQLLAFSRQQPISPTSVDLNTVVTDMDKLLRRLIGEDIRLETKLDPELAPVVGDRGQLEQVIVNLAVNARDAMPDGGNLSIETAMVTVAETETASQLEEGKAYLRLTVCDTGRGMDEATRSRVFEPFFTTKERGKGTGLGLSTVYGIVEHHGGHLTSDSAPGEGATFTIYLPAAPIPGPSGRRQGAVRPDRGKEKVLLVEDEEMIRPLVARILREHGYTVLEADNGEAAIEHARRSAGIDVVVTDIVMPGMSGFELSERLRKVAPDVRVLFMSGYTDPAITRHGTVPDGTSFLAKPFTPAMLLRKIRDVLDVPKPMTAAGASGGARRGTYLESPRGATRRTVADGDR